MSKFNKLKEQRMRDEIPFLTYELKGEGDCFVVDSLPLMVTMNPPSLTYILGSDFITTNILRHSATYQDKILKRDVQQGEEASVIQDAVNEIANKLTAGEDAQLKQLAIIIGIGRHYLMDMAIDCYYDEGEETEKRQVVFVEKKAQVATTEEAFPDAIVFHTGEVSEKELFEIGMELFSAIPTKNIPSIAFKTDGLPVKGLEIESSQILTGQESEATGETSIPANQVAKFPRYIRGAVVEDVSTQSSQET